MRLWQSVAVLSVLVLVLGLGLATAAPRALKYRNVRAADVKPLAELCAATFEGPFAWHQVFQRQKAEREYEEQLQDRLIRLVGGGLKHAMVLAEPEETPDEGGKEAAPPVAFVEVGMLPSPTPSVDGDRPDVLFLGNVAVAESARRRGVGTKLVRVAERLALKWQEEAVYVAVESDNRAALEMYRKLQFEQVLDERDNINRRGTRLFLRKTVVPKPEE